MANSLADNEVVQTTPFLTQRLQFNCDTRGFLLGGDVNARVELALVGRYPDEFYYTFCNSVTQPGGIFELSGNVALDFTAPIPSPNDPIGLQAIYEGDTPTQAGGFCIVVWLKWYAAAQFGNQTFEYVADPP